MATKSKHRKNHKEKVDARNKRLAVEKKKKENFQKEFLMNLIKQEQERGLFNDTTGLESNPILNGPTQEAGFINGPLI